MSPARVARLAQALMMPLLFVLGALFPLTGLPGWLSLLTRLDPLTYAVEPVRRAVLAHLAGSGAGASGLIYAGVSWGALVPTSLEVALVATVVLLALGGAIAQIQRAG